MNAYLFHMWLSLVAVLSKFPIPENGERLKIYFEKKLKILVYFNKKNKWILMQECKIGRDDSHTGQNTYSKLKYFFGKPSDGYSLPIGGARPLGNFNHIFLNGYSL